MPNAVLTLNAGSSSIKFAVFEATDEPRRVSHGQIEAIGIAPHFRANDASGRVLVEQRWAQEQTHEALLQYLLDWVTAHLGNENLIAVGHRVVHGGPDHGGPALITGLLLDELHRLAQLAPLHQPHNLSAIPVIAATRPGLPQVACFDTAFHRSMLPIVTRLALPREYAEAGVRRYGFHGLSYEFIARRLRETAPDLARGRVIVAHLGNGASLCAMRDGHSIDTTMGFTALDGLVMGTRCGTTDPGAILYLVQQQGMDAKTLETLLYRQSGLLGVSGLSSDMRTLQESGAPEAREGIELFVFRIAREAGALASTLGGVDGFVFTAGIGENDAAVRAAVCERLGWLGAVLDPAANARGDPVISAAESRLQLRVIKTDEEAMIARHTLEILGGEDER